MLPSNNLSDYVGKIANTLIDDIKIVVVLIDAKGIILYANKELSKVLGYSHQELIGLQVNKLIPLESLPQALKSIALELAGATTPEMDINFTTKSGTKRTLRFPSWNSSNVSTPLGKALLIWGYDVTEELKTKKELQEKVKELETLNKYMIGRENKMVELKEEIKKLKNN